MEHTYSLAHLVDLSCPPPDFVRAAARAGYNAVSLRTMGGEAEHAFNLCRNRRLLHATWCALKDTGLVWTDTDIIHIDDNFVPEDYELPLATAAELGAGQVTVTVPEDWQRYMEQFAALCELARQYDQVVNVEFITLSGGASSFSQTRDLLLAAGQANAGLLVDTLHCYRSRTFLREVGNCPAEWFNCVHLYDCPEADPLSREELRGTDLDQRRSPTEGLASIRDLVRSIPNPNPVFVLEGSHRERLASLGLDTCARALLDSAKSCLETVSAAAN